MSDQIWRRMMFFFAFLTAFLGISAYRSPWPLQEVLLYLAILSAAPAAGLAMHFIGEGREKRTELEEKQAQQESKWRAGEVPNWR